MGFLVAKSIHIVGFISWFAGLFYIVRLFVYFEEAKARPEHEARVVCAQLAIMQGRLWTIITRPAMVVTVLAGLFTIHARYGFSQMPMWLHVKLGLLLLLLVYHHLCGRIVAKHRAQQPCGKTPTQLRIFNEVATMFMVAIVCLAVFKSSMSAVWGLLSWVALGVVLMVALRLYKRARAKQAASIPPAGVAEPHASATAFPGDPT